MKRLLYFIIVLFCFAGSGCVKFGAATPDNTHSILLPGECLQSTELSHSEQGGSHYLYNRDEYVLFLVMDMSGYTKYSPHPKALGTNFRTFPSDEMYQKFGENSERVKDEYKRVFNKYDSELVGIHNFTASTILYDGGMKLVADKEFAGYPAGTDLGPYCYFANSHSPMVDAKYALDLPLEYDCLMEGDCIWLRFPCGDYSLTKERVTFDVEIPVKVVMYLQWLNDRLSDPSAPVPYEEQVLHCHFSADFSLK